MIFPQPQIYTVSDTAFSVEFGAHISRRLNRRVMSLTKLLDELRQPAIVEVVPSYSSVMVEYDPHLMNHTEMAAWLAATAARASEENADTGRKVEIPVCYGGEFGPDLPALAAEKGLTEQEVIDIHSSVTYPVYMMGFTPGFPYLGGMDSRIAAPRLSTPRTAIPPGSVGIAGEQTGVYPLRTPGGWRLIGRTPLKLFDKNSKNPFLLAAGDIIEFVPIGKSAYILMGGECND